MQIILHKNQKTNYFTIIKIINWIVIPILILFFIFAIQTTANKTGANEAQLLEDTIRKSAVHYYSLEGVYPESLDDLLSVYHITYNENKYIIEYTPQMSNLLPEIAIIPRKSK